METDVYKDRLGGGGLYFTSKMSCRDDDGAEKQVSRWEEMHQLQPT